MGDNQATWEHLELSLPMLCNMGLSGVAFVGCDVGGFAGNTTAELFTRWIQVGILYPLMRAHSAMGTVRREPWVYGEEVEDICRKYIQLRYRLTPYLYTLFQEAATTGAPILRPLLYEYFNDPKVYELHDQVLLGSSILAAPICRPGVEARSVYLPDGVWYDWWTGEKSRGGRYILAHAPLEVMPLYVRAGSIIPLYPVCQHLDEIPDSLTLRVYPGEGEFTLYEDDGHSFDYREGMYSTTRYKVSMEGEEAIVEVFPRQGLYRPGDREISIEVVGRGERSFTDDGRAKRWTF
jgi:alpha-glucosidase